MSDLRLDPLTGNWVAIASNRAGRPYEFQQIEKRNPPHLCPFCPGNEAETPPAVAVVDDSAGTHPWLVRVVPNKFPSFPNADSATPQEHGPYTFQSAQGVQEVIIQSPRHIESMSDLSSREVSSSFRTFRNRVREIRALPEIQHAMLFKNCRPEAGASLQHIHAQLIGTPLVPLQLEQRWQRMEAHRKQTGLSLLESICQWELERETRVLEATDRFVVFCPYASRFGYQIWIVPRNRQEPFAQADDTAMDELGDLTQTYIRRLETVLDMPAYNLLFHFAPKPFEQHEHWFVEIFPRITRLAGFEWGTGWWVNPFAPEDVAVQLKNA